MICTAGKCVGRYFLWWALNWRAKAWRALNWKAPAFRAVTLRAITLRAVPLRAVALESSNLKSSNKQIDSNNLEFSQEKFLTSNCEIKMVSCTTHHSQELTWSSCFIFKPLKLIYSLEKYEIFYSDGSHTNVDILPDRSQVGCVTVFNVHCKIFSTMENRHKWGRVTYIFTYNIITRMSIKQEKLKVTVKEDNFSNLQVLLVKLGTPGPVVGCLFTPRDTESVTVSLTGSNQHKQITRIITGHRPPPSPHRDTAVNILSCNKYHLSKGSKMWKFQSFRIRWQLSKLLCPRRASILCPICSPQSQTWLVRVWSNFLSVC